MANRLNTHPVNSEILKILIQTANYRKGSIVALVKQNGTVSERYSYDAWGRRRNPANWADYNVLAPRLIARGYTSHEHLDGFGLINMNGRMYDPVIGRVLSPDNGACPDNGGVQDPTNTQSYNRYSYCLNNPLRYTDPSGCFAAAADQYWNMGVESYITRIGTHNFGSSSMGTSGGSGSGYSYCWEGGYYTFNGISTSYNDVYCNFIAPNIVANLPSNTDLKTVEMGRKGVYFRMNLDLSGYSYRIGIPGSAEFNCASTPVYAIGYRYIPFKTPSEQGLDWKGITNATIGLIGGVAEMAVGGASEYFSVGTTTAISGPLMLDGGVRAVANAQRLFQYFNGNAKMANAYPTNLGGLAGKGIDMALGTSAYKVGLGQSIGSMGNDFTSFIATGGTGGALLDLMKTPSVSTGFNYFFTVGSYPYSLYYDKPDK